MQYDTPKKLLFVFLSLIFIACNNELELEEDDCIECLGRGYSYCNICYNRGYCTYCKRGWICDSCSKGWEGTTTCFYCNGNSRHICYWCHGGYRCWSCHGKKTICTYCKGTGKIIEKDLCNENN